MIKCPNCGGLNPDGVTICGACAMNLTSLYSNNVNNAQANEPIIINDYVLTNSYIGQNAYKLSKPSFSVNTLFFGIFYLWYRKMYALVGIWLALALITSLLYMLTGSYAFVSALAIIINVYFAIRFKTFYINHVNKQVAKIKREHQGEGQQDLQDICKRKGRTTKIPVALGLLALAGPTFILGKYIYETTYTNWNNLKKEEFIEVAHMAITNVRTDITIKSVHVYDTLIYDSGDIKNISDMRVTTSPYGEPYKEFKVKVSNTRSGTIYSVCMIDQKNNGFAYTTESALNKSIVKHKTAPSTCE